MLKLDGITRRLDHFTVEDVSLEVQENDYFVLLGPSGSGKTVLLELIAGLLRPDSGRILLEGRDMTREDIQSRGIGLVYQDRALFPHMSVRANIEYGLHGRKMDRASRRTRVQWLAAQVGVDHLLERSPARLSGGEAQRVALARTLATEPLVLMLDEPISSLDAGLRREMRALLRRLHRGEQEGPGSRGRTMIHVTHDYEEARSLATRVAVMEGGRIVQVGSSDEIFSAPASEFVARFVGVRNYFVGEVKCSPSSPWAEFEADGVVLFHVDPDFTGSCALISRRDIHLSRTRPPIDSPNLLRGAVADMALAPDGIEVTVDVGGLSLSSLLQEQSVEGLEHGDRVWLCFDPSAVRGGVKSNID